MFLPTATHHTPGGYWPECVGASMERQSGKGRGWCKDASQVSF